MRILGLVLLSVTLFGLVPHSAQATPGAAQPDPGSLDRLVALVAQRLDTADAVAAAKWAVAMRNGAEPVIDDPVREAGVYDAMARLGAGRDLPGARVRQVFYGQIEASKIVQRGLVMRWRFDLAAPGAPPDLAVVRPAIDRMNVEIVDQLAAQRGELAAPDGVERLAHGVFGVLAADGRDALHHAALVRASAALCPA